MKLSRIYNIKNIFLAALITVTLIISAGAAQAALFSDTHNFSGSGTLDGRDYIEIASGNANPYVFSYTHNVTFIPPAASITSAQIVLSHNGNSNSGNGELWFLAGTNQTMIGQLDRSTQGNNWVDQVFVLPTSLYSAINGGSWSLQLVLTETTPGNDKLQIDQSVLSGTYVPTPIPAAAWLLGSGLMGLVGIRRRTGK
jgi:hypothetical protein